MPDAILLDTLKQYWGHDVYRPVQADVVQAVAEGFDVLALLPTGGGKSICFQAPALALNKICLVVSPLIALMKDQVEQLEKRNIPALFFESGLHPTEVDLLVENCKKGMYKFIYTSPERIESEQFRKNILKFNIQIIAIDEAHCISQWGHDFRPSYLKLHQLKTLFPKTQIVALTATATTKVQIEIVEILRLNTPKIFKQSFKRTNISYMALQIENKLSKCFDILNKIKGTAIIYVRSRKKTAAISEWLQKSGISADFYHAGLTFEERNAKQKAWMQNKSRVIVATNAFGMGIDKSDVRLVIHIDIPESIEAYYQEAGRAGRDLQKSYSVVIFNSQDLAEYEKAVEKRFPDVETVKQAYFQLANHYQIASGGYQSEGYDFDIDAISDKYKIDKILLYNSLKHIENQGFITYSEDYYSPAKIHIPDRTAAYQFQLSNAKYDILIKEILRQVGGAAYTDFVLINEYALSKKLTTDQKNIRALLAFLNAANVLIYKPMKNYPQIFFLTERFGQKQFPFNNKQYEERKNTAQKKTDAVVAFITNKMRCRSKILLEYLDEICDTYCGVCDVCISNKKTINDDKFLPVLAFIKDNICTAPQIKKQFYQINDDAFVLWIKNALDLEIIYIDQHNHIRLHEKH